MNYEKIVKDQVKNLTDVQKSAIEYGMLETAIKASEQLGEWFRRALEIGIEEDEEGPEETGPTFNAASKEICQGAVTSRNPGQEAFEAALQESFQGELIQGVSNPIYPDPVTGRYPCQKVVGED